MRGVANPRQETGIVQDGGRGTDGGKPSACAVLAEDQLTHPGIGAKQLHAGPARQKHTVERLRKDGGQGGVGMHRQAVSSGGVNAFAQGGEGNGDTRAAQQVNGGDGLNLLNTIRQDCENGGHAYV